MDKIMLSLKDVYNIMEASGSMNALVNLKEIIESKDVEISNCRCTIRKRNLLIANLRLEIKQVQEKLTKLICFGTIRKIRVLWDSMKKIWIENKLYV